jgi:hypothetical protein
MADKPKCYRVTLEVTQAYSLVVDAEDPKTAAALASVDAASRLPAIEGEVGLDMLNRTTRATFIELERNDPRPKIRN